MTGALITPGLVVWLSLHYGWRAAFVATGAVGLLWVVAWFACYDLPERHPRIGTKELQLIRADTGEETSPIGLGVQIAAALHVAASIPNLMYVECNPKVWEVAEGLLKASLPVGAGVVGIPEGLGLGVEIDEEKLQPFVTS